MQSQDIVYLVNEEIPAVVSGVNHASLLDFTPHTVAEGVLVFLGAQVGDVSSGQKVIDVHQELFIDNLVVSHEESNGCAFNTSLQGT